MKFKYSEYDPKPDVYSDTWVEVGPGWCDFSHYHHSHSANQPYCETEIFKRKIDFIDGKLMASKSVSTTKDQAVSVEPIPWNPPCNPNRNAFFNGPGTRCLVSLKNKKRKKQRRALEIGILKTGGLMLASNYKEKSVSLSIEEIHSKRTAILGSNLNSVFFKKIVTDSLLIGCGDSAKKGFYCDDFIYRGDSLKWAVTYCPSFLLSAETPDEICPLLVSKNALYFFGSTRECGIDYGIEKKMTKKAKFILKKAAEDFKNHRNDSANIFYGGVIDLG